MHHVYIITNLLNYKIYVGQTHTPKGRWSAHKCEAKSIRAKYPIHFAIRKYGDENFEFSIIDNAPSQDEINKLEIYWIEKFDSLNSKMGYNLAVGGNSNSGWHHSEESKRKISESSKGKIMPLHSKEWKENMSKIMSGRIINEEWKNKISSAQRMFTREQELKIYQDRKSGMLLKELSQKYNCSVTAITRIIKRNE